MPSDLLLTRDEIRAGRSSPQDALAACLQAAHLPACAHAYVRTMFDQAQAAVAEPGLAELPLAGLSISIKDLFDLQGQTTAAGSKVLAAAAPALRDARAVARLKAAGGVVLGRTHMVEFAFSGVGTNPHYPTPANAADAKVARIPGGSSSGAAVSVASGSAYIGLGSDTGGSIRVPAALNGIVGFKCTQSLVPLDGAYPLSQSLDTVCAMTRSVRDAVVAHEILAARKVIKSSAPLSAYRLAAPQTLMLDALEPAVAQAFEQTLATLRAAGARIDDIALPQLAQVQALFAGGGLAAMESYAWHRELLARAAADYDPRVRARIERGAAATAHEYLDLLRARAAWIAAMQAALSGYDAMVSPTVPITAPPIASVAPGPERDDEFFRVNALLLRNTSAVNQLDGCAISIPCQAPGALPVGLMLWAPALRDDAVLNIALLAEAALAQRHAA